MNGITRRLHISFLSLVCLLGAWGAKAQDSLRMRTGAVYSVRVIEIADEVIKYRTYNNPDGPLYTVSKGTIYEMKLENQRWEPVNAAPLPTSTGRTSKRSADRKPNVSERNHYIGINLLDLIRTDLTIYYEWIFKNKVGLRVPVTYGFRSGYFNPNTSMSNPFGFQRNTVFKTGIDLRVYSGQGNGRVRFVFGPAIYYMRLNRIPADYLTTDPDFMVFTTGNSMRILFFNGILIKPADFLQFGFDAGFGGDIDFGVQGGGGPYITGTPTVPKVQLNLHLGYRF